MKYFSRIPFWISLIAVLSIIYDFGFDQDAETQDFLHSFYIFTLITGVFSAINRYFLSRKRPLPKVWFFDALFFLLLLGVLSGFAEWDFSSFFHNRYLLYFAVILVFFREVSAIKSTLTYRYLNPAQLFIVSFFAIIVLGTFLLLLPRATYSGIGVIDALFTSTSAVCVTGLIVVDTGSYFTTFGQVIIMILIQAGGIGIMTFTSYFSYFFRGGASYESQILLKDMTNSEKIAEVFRTMNIIILLTIAIEAAGAAIIFTTLDSTLFTSAGEQMFFSVFHAVSGFCNAGFSTLSDSLFEGAFRFNYNLHLTIAFLFILGGLGFPIVFNILRYLKHLFINRIFRKESLYVPWVININTRIVLITTLVLILTGTFFFYIFEYNNTLAEHGKAGKVITAFFGAVTPRTAGFNTVDTSALAPPTVLLVLFLMWVGASPGSTGGGIKTSSLAIAFMNVVSLARGKDRIEVFRREVSEVSVKRAFAIMLLSFIVAGSSIILITGFEPERELLPVAFECFSAYSTVGLSMGITGDLGNPSKMVIVFTMFIGRVSMLTILVAFLRKIKYLNYRYPSESILIN
ncbi:MAG: potassium transporter TrkG [Bacteroidales bacterium]